MRKKSKYVSTAPDFRNMETFADTVGDRIRSARRKIGMSADRLAVQVGCSQSTISQYERGVRDPTPDMLKKIAEALECKVHSLYTSEYLSKSLLDLPPYLSEAGYEDNFNPYTRNYEIGEDEYIRFSVSFERLTMEGRAKIFEYLEDIAELPKYQGKGYSSGNDEKT